MNMEEKNFGEILKELRNYHALSQKDLADVTGIPYNTLTKYEINDRRPNFDSLLRLAHFFNTSVDYMMGYSNYLLDFYDYDFLEELMELSADKLSSHLNHFYNIDVHSIDYGTEEGFEDQKH